MGKQCFFKTGGSWSVFRGPAGFNQMPVPGMPLLMGALDYGKS